MQDPLLDCEADIRDYLAEHTTTQCPPLLAQAMEYAVFPGGARVRPQLCMAVALANNSSDRPLAAAAATAVEFLHCASLVHDDLPCFDDATERRGKPSVHAKFGERIAVLTGDALIVAAFQTLAVHAMHMCVQSAYRWCCRFSREAWAHPTALPPARHGSASPASMWRVITALKPAHSLLLQPARAPPQRVLTRVPGSIWAPALARLFRSRMTLKMPRRCRDHW
jgi:hypothetical protein